MLITRDVEAFDGGRDRHHKNGILGSSQVSCRSAARGDFAAAGLIFRDCWCGLVSEHH